MFNGRTLSDLAKELERQAESKKDFKTPASLCEMSVRNPINAQQSTDNQLTTARIPELQFRVGDKFQGELTELMHDQVGSFTGVPSKYYERMRSEAPALLSANVNHWMRQQKETRLVRTLDGKARAFLSNRYRTIDNFDVANATLPVLLAEASKLGALEVVSTEVTDKRLYIKAISKRLTYEVKKGDAVQMGIVISNSEVGLASVRIEPFLLRLICLNGAIIEDAAVRKFHIGRQSAELEAAEQVYRDETRMQDDRTFVMKLQDVTRAAFSNGNFEKLKGITIDATTRKISAPVQDVVEEVVGRYGLPERMANSFLTNLIEGADVTQWGLANAVTAAANTAANYEEATRLEKIGGEIIAMDGNQWKQLAEAV